MIVSSVRARLALWHTVVLAVLLVAFAAGAYAFVAHAVEARTDTSLADVLLDLRSELRSERSSGESTAAIGRDVVSEMRFRTITLAVLDSSGRVLAATAAPRLRRPLPEDSEPPFDPHRLAPLVSRTRGTHALAITLPDAEGGYRVSLAPLQMADGRFTIAAATPIHADAQLLSAARTAMLVAILLAIILAWGGGWLLAQRSLAPMVAIREATTRIGASTLGERVPIANAEDEVGQLAAVINDLLGRLERAFAQQRQFMADASHELRTPVAVVQSEASRALSRSRRTPAEYEDALLVVQTAGRRLRRIVDDLFLLARADSGELPVRHDLLYLDEVVGECVREVRSLAERQDVQVVAAAADEATYEGDEALLHRLLINLLDNAIKHTPSGGTVMVRLAHVPGEYRVEVANPGPPIPPELAPRIFDRFVRGDAARSRQGADSLEMPTSGAGLGLSIARWIAAAHRGTLELSRSDESATVFLLRLPFAGA